MASRIRFVVFFVLAAVIAIAAQPSRKILFIGNSLTYFQDGIYYHLEKLAGSAVPPLIIKAAKSVFGGGYFKTLWERTAPRDAIRNGAYDVVVLQEDLPETTVAAFREYAPKFVEEIRKVRGRPVPAADRLGNRPGIPKATMTERNEVRRSYKYRGRENVAMFLL